jgi:beta-lactamase regulating signal transducer with metallopeptidase domain
VSALLPWAVEALIASTVLMLLVLVLRQHVRRAFGPDVAYALWLLPVLRLLLPPLPQGWHEAAVAPVARASQSITILVAEPLGFGGGAAAPDPQTPVLGPALIMLWVAGAAAFMLWHSLAHARFCRRMLAEQRGGAAIADGIHVIETDAARGPLAFGIWRRYVAFPRDFTERYDADERDLALAHELGHHARGDLIANWAALAVLALHWFNPVAWRAFRAFRVDQEIANDARVLAGRDAVTRHLYACAIVKAAHGGAVSAACHLHTIEDLKGRLKMLTTHRPSRARLIGGVGTVALLTLVGLGTTASGTQAAERVRSKVEQATGVKLDAIKLPIAFQTAPPAPPAAPDAPGALPAPDAPPAPPAMGPDGKPIKHRYRVVIRDRDGQVTETDSDTPPEAIAGVPPVPPVSPVSPVPPMPPVPGVRVRTMTHVVSRDRDGHVVTDNLQIDIPEISSANCEGPDTARPPVMHKDKGGKRVIIICQNRIDRMAHDAAVTAARSGDIARNAYAHALAGLRSARATVAGNAAMAVEARNEALKGIDEAIREIEGDIAREK